MRPMEGCVLASLAIELECIARRLNLTVAPIVTFVMDPATISFSALNSEYSPIFVLGLTYSLGS